MVNRFSIVLALTGLLPGGCCNEDFIVPSAIDYDFYEGAIDLTTLINSCSADALYSTTGATSDGTAGACWSTTTPQFNRWFRFTAPANGQIRITIDVGGTKGTQLKTQLALWESDGVTPVGCNQYLNNDDDVVLAATGLTPGISYYFTVDTEDSASRGSFTCCLSNNANPTQLHAFVSNAVSDDISVIDPLTQVETDRLTCTSTCNEPRNLALSPNRLMLYVPYRHSNLVSVVDPETMAVIADITDPGFDEPYAVAFTADNKEAWVVNKQGGGSSTGSISVINTVSRAVVATINHISISSPEGITLANGKAYIANRGDGDIPVFNVATRAFITTINAPESETRYTVSTPSGNFVYAANGTSILKIETTNNTIVTTIPIPAFSRNMATTPDGSKIFVAVQSNVIYAIDVSTNLVTPVNFGIASSIYAVAVSSTGVGLVTDESTDEVYLFNPVTNAVINDSFGVPIQIPAGNTPRAIVAQ